MKHAACLALLLPLLAGCVTQPAAPIAPVSTRPVPIDPLTLQELRGREVALFPDIPLDEVIARTDAHLVQCYPGRVQRTSRGFVVSDDAGRAALIVSVARVSQSGALGLGGPALSSARKEALASAVQGRPGCA